MLGSCCRCEDGRFDPVVGATTAQVALHRTLDFLLGGIGSALQQRDCAHDLSGLAVPALGHRVLFPRLLNWVKFLCGEAFDGGDWFVADGRDRDAAGTNGVVAEVDGTRAAERLPAAVLGSGEADYIADDPKKGHIFRHLDGSGLAIYLNFITRHKSTF